MAFWPRVERCTNHLGSSHRIKGNKTRKWDPGGSESTSGFLKESYALKSGGELHPRNASSLSAVGRAGPAVASDLVEPWDLFYVVLEIDLCDSFLLQ